MRVVARLAIITACSVRTSSFRSNSAHNVPGNVSSIGGGVGGVGQQGSMSVQGSPMGNMNNNNNNMGISGEGVAKRSSYSFGGGSLTIQTDLASPNQQGQVR